MGAMKPSSLTALAYAGMLGLDIPKTKLDGVAWFVQISDLHLSRYDHLPDRQKLHGDKLGDLRRCSP